MASGKKPFATGGQADGSQSSTLESLLGNDLAASIPTDLQGKRPTLINFIKRCMQERAWNDLAGD